MLWLEVYETWCVVDRCRLRHRYDGVAEDTDTLAISRHWKPMSYELFTVRVVHPLSLTSSCLLNASQQILFLPSGSDARLIATGCGRQVSWVIYRGRQHGYPKFPSETVHRPELFPLLPWDISAPPHQCVVFFYGWFNRLTIGLINDSTDQLKA